MITGFTTPGSRMMGTVAGSGDLHLEMSSKSHSGSGIPHVKKFYLLSSKGRGSNAEKSVCLVLD